MLSIKTVTIALIGLSLLLLSSCQSTQPEPKAESPAPVTKAYSPDSVYRFREQMIGWWYGDRIESDGERVQWIFRQSESSQIMIKFKTTAVDGSIEETQVIGEWGVRGNLYIAIIKGWVHEGEIVKTDTTNPHLWHVYEVKKLSENELHYQSLDNNVLYKATRVPTGFDFPE